MLRGMVHRILTCNLDQHDDDGVEHGIIASHTNGTDFRGKDLSSVLKHVSRRGVKNVAKDLPWRRMCS